MSFLRPPHSCFDSTAGCAIEVRRNLSQQRSGTEQKSNFRPNAWPSAMSDPFQVCVSDGRRNLAESADTGSTFELPGIDTFPAGGSGFFGNGPPVLDRHRRGTAIAGSICGRMFGEIENGGQRQWPNTAKQRETA